MRSEVDTTELETAAAREIEGGLTACQVAVARDNVVLWTGSFGSATDNTRFWVASATKPIVSSAIWHLIADGKLDISRAVADYAPEFADNGKRDVTVEQVLLMTCGFPSAPMDSNDGADPARRIAQLAQWTLEYEPGTKYVYHGMSAHWVLAELIERLSGQDFRDFVEGRVTRPLGLPRLLGIPREEQTDIAQLSAGADAETRALYDYAADPDLIGDVYVAEPETTRELSRRLEEVIRAHNVGMLRNRLAISTWGPESGLRPRQ